MQNAFDQTMTNLNMHGMQLPVTPDIAAKILHSIAFEMTNEDALSTGIHCFTFSYLDQDEMTSTYEQMSCYLLIQQGQGAPTLMEAASFTTPLLPKLACMLTEATITYNNTHIALHTLLGDNHAMVCTFNVFWTLWNNLQTILLNVRTPTPHLFLALCVCWVQLCLSLWFAQQAIQMEPVQAPNFMELLSKICLQKNWEPTIPE